MADDIEKTKVTLEELQAQLLEQNERIESLEAEKSTLNDALTETKNSLKSARELNAKFFAKGVNNEHSEPNDNSNEPETQEQFIDSFLKVTAGEMKKIYGDEFVGNIN